MEKPKKQTEQKEPRRATLVERLLSGVFVIGLFGIVCYAFLIFLMSVI